MIEKKIFCVPSSDGIHKLSGTVYLPDGEIKGLFHVVHGMTEHIARYDKFLSDMANEGWISFGYDNLGHGKTANNDSELGYIAKKKGWELLAMDVKVYADAVRKEFGTADMKLCLMGHSMGSFIVRLAAQRFIKPNYLIVMGTGGANPAADAGILLIKLIKTFRGDRHFSRLIDNMAFGAYNKRFGNTTAEDPKLWLTNDAEVRKAYYADKYCMFNFTVSAMEDLIKLIKYTNSAKWYKDISSDIKILLTSGEEDPVGNYGMGVRTVEKKLKDHKKNVTCRLYSGARHEILNDFTYESVKNDIVNFVLN